MKHEQLQLKLKQLEEKFLALETQLGESSTIADHNKLAELSKKHAELLPVVKDYREWKLISQELKDLQEMIDSDDPEIVEMAKIEFHDMEAKETSLLDQLQFHLIPKDPYADRNIIMEIRAGTGGDEAGIFAGDLFRMYSRYAENNKWKVELMSSTGSEQGGYKEIILSIEGENVYSKLRFEGGGHRVQRVPVTEASGRIHTSAATVAVLPEAEEVDVQINNEDIRIDVYRSSGPGGQSVNTTDSAVRITHIPSGLVVSCQDEKSQHKNRAQALKVLRSRLLELEQSKKAAEESQMRKLMVGSGDRSERIRTYNYPQNRVTDHRINLTLHRLEAIMEGELTELIDALTREEQLDYLKSAS